MTNIYVQQNKTSNFAKELFSNKDLFLVITTLMVSALLELIFNDKNGIPKYYVVAIGMTIMVFSIHICSLIQSGTNIPNIELIGVGLFLLCVILSSFGYIICSRKRGIK